MWWCRGGRNVVFRTLVGPQQELQCLVSTTFSYFYSYSYSSKTGNKGKAAPLQERKMVDKFRVWAKGGDGGNGCCSVRRSRTDWRGKPDGGNGGRGGDVILQCSAAVWDFSNLQHHLNAKKGGHGASKKMAGSRGRDKFVQVPVGTVIHLVSGETPSFLDVTSKKDLQPWEIQDVGEDQEPAADGLVDIIVDDNAETSGLQPNSRTLETKTRYDKLPHIEHTVLNSKQLAMEHTSWSSSPSSEVDMEKEETKYGNEDDDMDSFGTESDEEIVKYDVAELTESGQQLVIAYGGQGGLGNASLGKGPKHHMKPKLPTESSNPYNIDDESRTSIAAGSPRFRGSPHPRTQKYCGCWACWDAKCREKHSSWVHFEGKASSGPLCFYHSQAKYWQIKLQRFLFCVGGRHSWYHQRCPRESWTRSCFPASHRTNNGSRLRCGLVGRIGW